jgi:hypothetical protein
MPTYTVHRVSLLSDNATEVDLFGWSFFSADIPKNFKQFLTQPAAAPVINEATAPTFYSHDHMLEPNEKLDLGDLGLYGIPFPRVTRSTSDPLKTTFPFTP